MSSSETIFFWKSVNNLLIENASETFLDVYLDSASLNFLSFLSLCTFAVGEYDNRNRRTQLVEKTLNDVRYEWCGGLRQQREIHQRNTFNNDSY